MRGNKLTALILIGLTACGFSFEFDLEIMPLVYLIVGLLAWKLRRRETSSAFVVMETALLVIGIPGAYLVSKASGWGPHPLIFVANALSIYQLFRLFLPMNDRQKRYGLTVAILHLSVATFVVVDWKFIMLLLLALYLIPGAMMEVEAAKYRRMPGVEAKSGNIWFVVGTAIMMAFFFVFFPRLGRMRYINPGRMLGVVQPPKEIDMSDTVGEGSDTKVMQVEGENLDYMRMYSLDRFDGTTWDISPYMKKMDSKRLRGEKLAESKQRTVKLLVYQAVGNVFPTDGFTIDADAPTSDRLYVAEHGGLSTARNFRRNFTYRYWTLKEDHPWSPLTEAQKRRFLRPNGYTPSARLVAWLDTVVGAESDPESVCDLIETRLQVEFTYELGVPTLKADSTMDDFIFNEKRGHCSRFASAMAVLARMRGIPSRVVVGYVPQEYNRLGEFYNIRDRNRHAWTEVWIDGRGWVSYDATPVGTNRTLTSANLAMSLYEWMEYTWYSKVVEFDIYRQNEMKRGVAGAWGAMLFWAKAALPFIMGLVGMLLLLFLFVVVVKDIKRLNRTEEEIRQEQVRQAKLFFGRMLALLQKRGISMQVGQTPRQFHRRLHGEGNPLAAPVGAVSEVFMEVNYGERPLTAKHEETVEASLKQIEADG